MSKLRELAVEYAKAFIGLPYIWGGDDPIKGFDCSGLILEVLQAVGIIPHGYDTTADGLYRRFSANLTRPGPGTLVFWLNSSGRAVHVEMMIDEGHVIGASGGGWATITAEEAARQNAFIKIRPLNYRGENYVILDPFKGVDEDPS